MAKDIIFDDDTSVVELPEQDEELPGGNSAVLAGWGLNRVGISSNLQVYFQLKELQFLEWG